MPRQLLYTVLKLKTIHIANNKPALSMSLTKSVVFEAGCVCLDGLKVMGKSILKSLALQKTQ